MLKRFFSLILALNGLGVMLLLNSVSLYAQTDTALKQDEEVFVIVEQMPSFQGEDKALHNFLAKNIKYPKKAKKKGIQGRVIITFVIDTAGNTIHIRVLRGIGGGCDEEAVRVIKLMSGLWEPGVQRGKKVLVQYNLPILFKLQ